MNALLAADPMVENITWPGAIVLCVLIIAAAYVVGKFVQNL